MVLYSEVYGLIFGILWSYIRNSTVLYSEFYGLIFGILWSYIRNSMVLYSEFYGVSQTGKKAIKRCIQLGINKSGEWINARIGK